MVLVRSKVLSAVDNEHANQLAALEASDADPKAAVEVHAPWTQEETA